MSNLNVSIRYFDDNSLDRWIMQPKSSPSKQNTINHQDDLSEILRKFHISANKNSIESSSPLVIFPANLQTAQPDNWLSSPTRKRVKTDNLQEDLSKWLSGKRTRPTIEKKLNAEDYDKWLVKSAPAASAASSLPGTRVEFRMLPLSAFRPSSPAMDTSDKVMRKEEASNNLYDQWLAPPSAQSCQAMHVEDDDDDSSDLNQWLLVNSPEPTTVTGFRFVDHEIYTMARKRDPSIVTLSDDELEDSFSIYSQDF